MTTEEVRKLWNKFLFPGFDLPFVIKNKRIWFATAEKAIYYLNFGNVAIISPAGSGKTIMAILAGLSKEKVLCLVDRNFLTKQHISLLTKLIGKKPVIPIESQSFSGKIAPAKRKWGKTQFTFSTPQVFLNDIEGGKVNLKSFDILIVDEFDLAEGDHPYTKAIKMARKERIPVLLLSATTGSKEKTKRLFETCFVCQVIRPRFDVPLKKENLEWVLKSKELEEVEPKFEEILGDIAGEMIDLCLPVQDPQKILSIEELGNIREEIKKIGKKHKDFYQGLNLHARYFKLRHLYQACFCESYYTFYRGVARLKLEDETKAAGQILNNSTFQEILKVLNKGKFHPKTEKLKEIVLAPELWRLTKIVFVKEVETANYFSRGLQKYDLQAAAVHSRMKDVETREIFKKLADRQINTVVSTSYAARGLNVPEIDIVINHTMPLNKVDREQKRGRAGRLDKGYIFYLCMDHPFDKIPYYGITSGQKKKTMDGQLTLGLRQEDV